MSVTLDALSLISKQLAELSEKVDALSERMAKPPPSRKRKECTDSVGTIQTCTGKTAKGEPCNHRAVEGKDYCKMHDPERKKRTAKSSTTTSAKTTLVKIEPVHTHEPTEKPEEACELCETHGDPLNGQIEEDVWSADYEIEPELNERLRALLEEHDL